MGEQPLKAKTCCNLGSLNLYEFVVDKFTPNAHFDFASFKEAIGIASNALDDIIEENAPRLPKELEEYKDEKIKKIGVLLEKSLREEIYRRQREEEKEQERYNTFE